MLKINKPSALLLVPALCAMLSGCNPSTREEQDMGLTGHYVNQTFLQIARDTVPGNIPVLCHELHFISPDSVKIYFGFEEATFPYQKSGNKYLIKNVLREKDLIVSIDSYNHLVLSDTSWTKTKHNSIFTKATPEDSEPWAFPTELNKAMIAGTYTMISKNKQDSTSVTLVPEGNVNGMPGFDSYELCFSGDCVGEVNAVTNNITFRSEADSAITYAFQVGAEGRSIRFYNIENPIEDLKGERAVKDLAFELRK